MQTITSTNQLQEWVATHANSLVRVIECMLFCALVSMRTCVTVCEVCKYSYVYVHMHVHAHTGFCVHEQCTKACQYVRACVCVCVCVWMRMMWNAFPNTHINFQTIVIFTSETYVDIREKKNESRVRERRCVVASKFTLSPRWLCVYWQWHCSCLPCHLLSKRLFELQRTYSGHAIHFLSVDIEQLQVCKL